MEASLLPTASVATASVPAAGIPALGGQAALSSAGLPAVAGVPGDMPTDFATVLAGLLGTGEPAQGGAPDGVLAPSVEAMAGCAAEDAADSPADAVTEGAMLVPEMPPGAPAPTPPPLSVPDLLARMGPPPQPFAAAPEAALADAATGQGGTGEGGTGQGMTGQGAMHALGAAPSASPSPPGPTMPADPLPDATKPAVSEAHHPARQLSPTVATEPATAPGGHIAAAASQPATPLVDLVPGHPAPSAAEAPDAPPDTAAIESAGVPPASAGVVIAAASAAPAARPGRITAEPVPPASTQTDPAPEADTARPLPAAAPLPAIALPPEPTASAPIGIATEPPPTLTLPDPRPPAPAEAMAAAPDTLPGSATGGASATPLGATAPEPPAAPARPTTPIPWPARQVVPFAVSLALGSDDSISLTLDPVELGRVEVAIARGADAHVSLRAERPETLALLQRDRAELERALAGTGFGAEGRAPSLSFGLGFGGNGEDRRDRRPATRDGQGARTAMQAPAMPSHQAAPTARGLIDLAF